MNTMQTINWDILKEKLQKCYDEHNSYIREFKMRNGNLILVTKFTHTEFKLTVTDTRGKVVLSPKINGPKECYDIIYSLLNQ